MGTARAGLPATAPAARTLDDMSRRTIAPAVTAVFAAALAVTLVACAPEGAQPSPSGSTSTGTAAPTATASASASTAPSSSPSADASACLAGDWTMDQGALESYYSDVNGLLQGAGIAFTPQGSASLTLTPEGAFSWAPDAQVNAEVAGTTIGVSVGGRVDGTYTATGDRISATSSVTDGLVVSATIDGADTDPGEVAQEIAGAPLTDASYTCAGDTLTIGSSVAGGTATAVLHRR